LSTPQPGVQTKKVDCVSFAAMRRVGAERAFAFDRQFRQQGFVLIP
jgi:predicted nucleic acid-binding protein